MADITKTAPPQTTLAQIIQQKQGSFAEVATKYLSPERLVKLAQLAISKMPDLQKVPATDIIAELINCSRLGLEPNVEGGRWLLPFERKGRDGKPNRWELVAITDYRGLVDIARRSGEVLSIHADIRHQADLWEYWIDSSGPTLVHFRHVMADGHRGDKVGTYAIVKLRSGEVQAAYLTLEEVATFKAISASAKSEYSPWQRNFDAMAKKTAIRRLYNLLPKTPEIQAAREVLAEEEDRERAMNAIDVTPSLEPAQPAGATTTDKVKAKLAGKTQPQPKAETKPSEPEPVTPSALLDRIAQIREEITDRVGQENAIQAWEDAIRECTQGRPSTQWSERDLPIVSEYLSTWRKFEVVDDTEREPGSDDE